MEAELTEAQKKALEEGMICRWCRMPLSENKAGRIGDSGGWEWCAARKHEPSTYILPEE